MVIHGVYSFAHRALLRETLTSVSLVYLYFTTMRVAGGEEHYTEREEFFTLCVPKQLFALEQPE
jgi:hypothetical protein